MRRQRREQQGFLRRMYKLLEELLFREAPWQLVDKAVSLSKSFRLKGTSVSTEGASQTIVFRISCTNFSKFEHFGEARRQPVTKVCTAKKFPDKRSYKHMISAHAAT